MQGWLNFNGSFIEEGTPVVTAGNRGLRYGDGLFETMKVMEGIIRRKDLHFQRLFRGMELLKIRLPALVDPTLLEEQVLQTLAKNKIRGAARVRLMVFRGDGGLYEFGGTGGGYIIQTWELPATQNTLNENGLVLGLYEGAFKSCDSLSNIKSNNYLPYVMAAIHAKENKWNDCVVLNSFKRACDTTIANIFWVKDGQLFTPPLSEGCVAGVMRAHLLDTVNGITEKNCHLPDLEQADEIFVTNATYGLRWVKEFNGVVYGNETGRRVFHSTI